MSSNGSGHRPVLDRLDADLRRIDAVDAAPSPAVASALRTVALSQDDFRLEVIGRLDAIGSDVKAMKRTVNGVVLALLPVVGALIFFGQRGGP